MATKRVLITGGPTNEYIDEVMKITNMSSGKLAVELAQHFVPAGYPVTLLLTRGIKHPILDHLAHCSNFTLMRFETTDELMRRIEECASNAQYDIIIHSAAVADYKPAFSFRLEDMAAEITDFIMNNQERLTNREMCEKVFSILADPDCKVRDDTKISSVEPNLTVKLGLTPKIIASLRELFPNAFIAGFKLLENVPEYELVGAAMKQLKTCNTNMCFANDLAELRKGNAARLVVTPGGYHNIRVDGAYGIFRLLTIATGE